MSEHSALRMTKEAVKEDILKKPNVIGIGVGLKEVQGQLTDQVSIVVLVRDKVPRAGLTPSQMVPPRVNSYETDVVEVGVIRAQQARTDRWRPAPGGVSIAHYQVTAGTLGAVVRDRATGQRLILSNNHVIANSNDAQIGDPILQPGPIDGGTQPGDVIAYLERFVSIGFQVAPGECQVASAYAMVGNFIARLVGSSHRVAPFKTAFQAVNEVDAAVARPISDSDVLDEILEIGTVTGTVQATLGMPVMKSGRTTGFTTGTITVLDATVEVSYGFGRVAQFENQIVSTPMSQGGDSGSLVVDADSRRAVGLLFAGSTQATVFNPIQSVLDALGVSI